MTHRPRHQHVTQTRAALRHSHCAVLHVGVGLHLQQESAVRQAKCAGSMVCSAGSVPFSFLPFSPLIFTKRRVRNTYGHLSTRLNSDVTSETSPLAIEGVKDGVGQANLASRLVKIKGENGRKEKGTEPAEHTMAPAHSDCLAANACCECGTTSSCKTARCECRNATHVCVTCWCLGRCSNRAPQNRLERTLLKGNTEGETVKWEGKRKRRRGNLKEDAAQCTT